MCNPNPKFLYVIKQKCVFVVYVEVADDMNLYRNYCLLPVQWLDADMKLDIVENL